MHCLYPPRGHSFRSLAPFHARRRVLRGLPCARGARRRSKRALSVPRPRTARSKKKAGPGRLLGRTATAWLRSTRRHRRTPRRRGERPSPRSPSTSSTLRACGATRTFLFRRARTSVSLEREREMSRRQIWWRRWHRREEKKSVEQERERTLLEPRCLERADSTPSPLPFALLMRSTRISCQFDIDSREGGAFQSSESAAN